MGNIIIEKIKKLLRIDEESLKKRLTKEERLLIFKVHSFFDMTIRMRSEGFQPPWQVYPVEKFFKEEEIAQLWQLKGKLPFSEKAFITKTLNIKLVENLDSISML